MSDANFTQRFRMLHQLLHEILGFGGSKMFIERNDQQMPHTKRANQTDLVWRGGEQVRRFLGPQYFFRMRIKCHHHRRAIGRPSMFRRSGNHCLMSEMDSVEHTDGEKERAW